MSHHFTQLFLFDNQKDSVQQFPILDQVVEVVQKFVLLGPRVRRADGVVETMTGQLRNQLFNKQQQKGKRNERQQKVVHFEEDLRIHGGGISQKVLTTENDNKVGHASNQHCMFLCC